MALHRVIILGAGFGGLAAAKQVTKTGAAVSATLIDQRNHHTFQPLLYQVATAGLDAGDISYTTRRIARDNKSLRALQGRVVHVDFDTQTVVLDDETRVEYDSLIFALGAVTADFGVPGVKEHAFGLKSTADAEALRQHVISIFDQVANSIARGETVDPASTTFAIVGGGPTGVEMAGGYAELTNRVLLPDFPEIDPKLVRIILIEGQGALLGGFAPPLQNKAAARLREIGVEVMLEQQVKSITGTCCELADGSTIPTTTVVWAAGVKANPLAEQLGLEVGRGGRVIVDDQLRVPGHSNVYAIGDLAATPQPNADGLVPQVAPVAIQGGEFVADRILDSLAHGHSTTTPEPEFRYVDKGSMATIGRNAAVVQLPNGKRVSGFLGWVAWLALHLVMLMGFRNRISVFLNWAWNYFTYDRGSRAVIETTRPELTSQTSTEEALAQTLAEAHGPGLPPGSGVLQQ